jgi:polysaccharide deacetylase family protein (PEP-CTERM system associated)
MAWDLLPDCGGGGRDSMRQKQIKNGLCVDVEGYSDISDALSVKKECLLRNSKAVLENLIRILNILDGTNTKGTFFVLACYVESIPEIAIEIERRGHEIGLHGYDHRPLYSLTEHEFERRVFVSLDIVKKHVRQNIIGFQAPDFSIRKDTFWVFDVLIKAGFKYDCSVFPIRHPNYGIKDFPRFPVHIKSQFYEIPMPTLRFFGNNIPFGGGGYLRLFPYWLNKFAFGLYNRIGHCGLTYVHPWEFQEPGDWLDVFETSINTVQRARYLRNCGENFSGRFERLMKQFSFAPVGEIYKELIHEDSNSDR